MVTGVGATMPTGGVTVGATPPAQHVPQEAGQPPAQTTTTTTTTTTTRRSGENRRVSVSQPRFLSRVSRFPSSSRILESRVFREFRETIERLSRTSFQMLEFKWTSFGLSSKQSRAEYCESKFGAIQSGRLFETKYLDNAYLPPTSDLAIFVFSVTEQ